MAAIGRSGIFAVCFTTLAVLVTQTPRHDSMLEGVPSGKTRVLDLSYAINDKLVPWPGDGKFFEAKVNATIEKNGYFTRSFWMLEHYGTHLDAPAHFPPGKTTVDQIPVKQLFGPAEKLFHRNLIDGCLSRRKVRGRIQMRPIMLQHPEAPREI